MRCCIKSNSKDSWDTALAGDNESAFGGVLVCNGSIDKATAEAINEIFFEVLIAPAFDEDALTILKSKKNRILLKLKNQDTKAKTQFKSVLNGILAQDTDQGNYTEWKEVGGRETTASRKRRPCFCQYNLQTFKDNAIALVRNKQLVGKGCGQTSRIDSLRQSIDKAKQFNFDLHGAVLANDAFFPLTIVCRWPMQKASKHLFSQAVLSAIKTASNIAFRNSLALVMTGLRHFKH